MSATADLAHRFSSLYTGALTDVLDRHGYLQQTLPPELAPLRPGMRLAGPVHPVLGRPHPGHDYDTSIRLVLEMGRGAAGPRRRLPDQRPRLRALG